MVLKSTLLLILCFLQPSIDACSEETFVFKNVTNGLITDGPGKYKSNQRCKWLISNPYSDDISYISLQFTQKDLECSFDYVIVFASDEEETKILATISGNTNTAPLPAINARAHTLLIYFFSDVNYELSGFSAMFYIYDCPNNCSGNGKCIDNSCFCFHTWIGEDCSESICPHSCSGSQGDCLYESTKRCTCRDGYLGIGCQMPWDSDALSNTWVTVYNYTDIENVTTSLVGHAGCYVEPYLWIFGGFNLNHVFGQLLKYDFSNNSWETKRSERDPSPRYYHTLSHVQHSSNHYLLLFGGEGASKNLSDELWIYNISQMSWQYVENNLNSILLPTSQHAAAVVDFAGEKFLYIHGGKVRRASEVVLSSAMYRFRWNNSWELVIQDPAGLDSTFIQLAGHTMVYDKVSHTLVVFGGYHLLRNKVRVERSQKLLIFDLNKSFWTEIIAPSNSISSTPKPIAFHTANIIGDYMVIFGGSVHNHKGDESCYDQLLYFFHLRCNTWTQNHNANGLHPSGRHSHVAAAGKENLLFIQGGYNGMASNDLFAYKVPTFVNKNISDVCYLYSEKNACLQDQRCAWMLFDYHCVFKNESSSNDLLPTCIGLCNVVNSCFSCAILNSYKLDGGSEWTKITCTWHVNKVSCYRSDGDFDVSFDQRERWWNSSKLLLLNSTSQCISSNIPPGTLAAFYFDDDTSSSPYQVSLIENKFSLDQTSVPNFAGDQRIEMEGFIHVYTEDSRIDISLQTKNAYGSLYLSEASDSTPAMAALRLENPGNLSQSDMAPYVSIDVDNGSRFYYKVIMAYTQEYEGQWTGYLELSWTIRNGNSLETYFAIKSQYLEPYRSLPALNQCPTYRDCLKCLLDYSCAWCAGRNLCISRETVLQSHDLLCAGNLADSGSITDHLYFGILIDPSSCPVCSIKQTCETCLEGGICSWNNTKGCQQPSAYDQEFQITLISSCPVPCSSRFTCSDCLANDGADECTWCSNTKRCFNFKYYHLINTFGDCVLWTRNNSDCHDCSAATTCQECVQSVFCGWCSHDSSAFQGSCVQGNLVGPDVLTDCPNIGPSRNEERYSWIYGHCDVDECSTEWPPGNRLHNCSPDASCTDTVMSYTCDCDRGFEGDGFQCRPTCYKNCLHGVCSGFPSYKCQCDVGWIGDSSSDVDCNTDCLCNFHSTCNTGIGNCDHCQHNTTGYKCHLCIGMHYGDAVDSEGCRACQCNGHGDVERGLCDSETGYCYCLNNTAGENCHECIPGYYGDTRNGGICYQECDGRYYNRNKSSGAFGTWNIQPKSPFAQNALCMYIIPSTKNDLILLKIDKNLNINCSHTSLLVYDDFTADSFPLASVCGRGLDNDLTLHSTTGLLYVVYESDLNLANTGFNATFQILPCESHSGIHTDVLHLCNTSQIYINCSQASESTSGAVVWHLDRPGCHNDTSFIDNDVTPKGLFGHTIVAKDNKLWLYGGYGSKGVSSDLLRYNFVSKTWSLVRTSNTVFPMARYMHASVVVSNKMLVHGGMSGNGTTLNDIWEYRFGNTGLVPGWWRLRSNIPLPDVAGHTLTLCSDVVVLIGGISSTKGFSLNVWVFNTSIYRWYDASTRGSCMLGLYGHSANYDVQSDLIYVYGGLNYPSAKLNRKMYTYSVSLDQWSVVPPSRPVSGPLFAPPLRYFHSTVEYQNGNDTGFVLVGGKLTSNQFSDDVWLFRYACRLWVRLTSHDIVSPSIGAATAVVGLLNGSNNSVIYYKYGGYKQGSMLDSFLIFHITSLCKIAMSACECANLAAGCTLCSTTENQQSGSCISTGANSDCDFQNSTQHPLNSVVTTSCSTCASSVPNTYSRGTLQREDAVCEPIWCSSVQSCDDLVAFMGLQQRAECQWCSSAYAYVCFNDNSACSISEICQECILSRTSECPRNSSAIRPCTSVRNSRTKSFPNLSHSYLARFRQLMHKGKKHRHSEQRTLCSSFKNCTTCLIADEISGNVFLKKSCFWSTRFRKCLDLAFYELRCLGGQCGRVIRNSANFCPPNSCSDIIYCQSCLSLPNCGWLSFEAGNGRGLCVEGKLKGPNDVSNDTVGNWEFLMCPPENECDNGHHKCTPPFPDVCRDTEDGFECICGDKYLLSSNKSYCLPVCTPPCINGYCVRPNECKCDFHYTGALCDRECSCNGHSECWSPREDQFQICKECLNSTTGKQCQYCEKNFVGNPVNGGRCKPCKEICNDRSLRCDWNPDPHHVKFVTSRYEHGPHNASVVVCSRCIGHSEGRLCDACIDGYFKFDDVCHKCTCNGHDDVCDKKTGKCHCKNSTQTLHERDCTVARDPLLCLREQCDRCKFGYIGLPLNGGPCYDKFDVGGRRCFHPTHPDCSSSLAPERTSFFMLHPTFTNVELRLIVDVSLGEVDVYFSHQRDFFRTKTDALTGEQSVIWDEIEADRLPPANEPLQSPDRKKRESETLPAGLTRADRAQLKVKLVTVAGPYQIVSVGSGQALGVKGVQNRLIVLCSPYDYQLNTTRFYVILHARKSSLPPLLTSFRSEVTQGARGTIIFRQDLNSLNLFVFFSVFFSCFFLVISILIIVWKIRSTVHTQHALLAHHIQMQHMASRPFSSVYLNFSYQNLEFSNSKQKDFQVSSPKNKFANAPELLSSSRDSSDVLEHQIPLLHTTDDFLTVVTPGNGSGRITPKLNPPDLFVPQSSTGKILVVSKLSYCPNPAGSSSHNAPGARIIRSSSTPSLSKHPSCSYLYPPCRSAPTAYSNRTKPYKLPKQGSGADPIALERTDDMQAAVATFVLQFPGVGRQQCQMCLGSALISTRHISSTMLRDESPVAKRRKFATTKLLGF